MEDLAGPDGLHWSRTYLWQLAWRISTRSLKALFILSSFSQEASPLTYRKVPFLADHFSWRTTTSSARLIH